VSGTFDNNQYQIKGLGLAKEGTGVITSSNWNNVTIRNTSNDAWDEDVFKDMFGTVIPENATPVIDGVGLLSHKDAEGSLEYENLYGKMTDIVDNYRVAGRLSNLDIMLLSDNHELNAAKAHSGATSPYAGSTGETLKANSVYKYVNINTLAYLADNRISGGEIKKLYAIVDGTYSGSVSQWDIGSIESIVTTPTSDLSNVDWSSVHITAGDFQGKAPEKIGLYNAVKITKWSNNGFSITSGPTILDISSINHYTAGNDIVSNISQSMVGTLNTVVTSKGLMNSAAAVDRVSGTYLIPDASGNYKYVGDDAGFNHLKDLYTGVTLYDYKGIREIIDRVNNGGAWSPGTVSKGSLAAAKKWTVEALGALVEVFGE
jgi:hypothetical protein